MQLPVLAVPVIIRPDEHGVYDGREIARQLIRTAFQALIPYVNGCHACGDNLFTVIANDALSELHQQCHEAGSLDCEAQMWTTREIDPATGADPAERDRRTELHLKEARPETLAMLAEDVGGHRH